MTARPPKCPTCIEYARELANISFAWIAITDLAKLFEMVRRDQGSGW